MNCKGFESRSEQSRGLRCRSAAAHLLRLWVRIPPGVWMSFSCECCVLSGRGLCDGLITRPEESYRVWCVIVSDLETLWMGRPWWPALGPKGGEISKETVVIWRRYEPGLCPEGPTKCVRNPVRQPMDWPKFKSRISRAVALNQPVQCAGSHTLLYRD
jgi:hypothetical protein